MRSRDRFWLGLGLVGLLLAPTTPALGQAWLQARDEEGAGIRAGDFEIHPGIGVLGGYESNPFFRDDNDPSGVDDQVGPEGAASLRVSPHIDFSTLSTRRRQEGDEEVQLPAIDFRGGLSYIFTKFFIEGDGTATHEGRLDLNETFLPERPFSLAMVQELSRSRIPVQGASQANTHVGAGITPQLSTPGGLLKGRMGYKFAFDDFTDSANNNLNHLFMEHLSWEFLPKTALFEEIEVGLQSFPNVEASDFGVGGTVSTDKNDITRVTGRGGVNGALTKQIAMTLSAGITSAFVDGADDNKAPIAQAQLRWRPTPTYRMSVEGSYSNQNALQGNTVTRIGGGLKAELTVGGAGVLRALGKLESMRYGDDVAQLTLRRDEVPTVDMFRSGSLADAASTDPRSDLKVTLEASGEYRFATWLAMTLELSYVVNSSDYHFVNVLELSDGTREAVLNSAAYENLRFYAGLRAFL